MDRQTQIQLEDLKAMREADFRFWKPPIDSPDYKDYERWKLERMVDNV